jgi:hypothetical protein
MMRFCRFCLLMIFVFGIALRTGAADWWSMPDADFIAQYKNLATGSQVEQSRFAWMLFARVNQPKALNGKTFSQWELWPSNEDTFSPAVQTFLAANKIRTRPHLQAPKFLKLPEFRNQLFSVNALPKGEGEEVTRNPLSYDYMADPKRTLTTQAGVWSAFTSPNKIIDLPVGGIEIKAYWKPQALPGAYQITDGPVTYSLTGLHIMAKIDKTPADPFNSSDPSWFWTTFEFTGNLNRSNALKFVTYQDTLPSQDSAKLLSEASLSQAFQKYGCNGTQIRFLDEKKKPVVLGNTQMEWAFATPQVKDPVKWKSWTSSCHTCHGESSGSVAGQFLVDFFQFKPEVGGITGVPPKNLPIDFVWSIPFHAK